MNRLAGHQRKAMETRVLAAIAEHIPTWAEQHVLLGKILDIVSPVRDTGKHQEMLVALSDVMQLDPVLNQGRLDKLAAILLSQHYTPKQIRDVYRLSPETAWGKDWRSEGGTRPPSERALRDTIAMLTRRADDDQVVDLDGS